LIDGGAVGIVLSGPPGTSKSWYARRIAAKLTDGDSSRVRMIQFHPSYSYDDFIEGYVPQPKAEGAFAVRPKLFLRLCIEAKAHPEEQYVLVIDELNRGDPSKIFGELLTYIERDYRDQKVLLAYSGKSASVPKNVLVLATMNPYDKSVVDLDDALERRFDRIALDPSVDILKTLLIDAGMQGEMMGKVITFFNAANKKSPHGVGHAFFVGANDEAAIRRLWDHRFRFVFEKMFRFEPEALKEVGDAYRAIYAPPSAAPAAPPAPVAAP
jgi:5-methylcytosine-specific restriction protein B